MPVAVHHVDHPLIADALVRVRDANTPNALFRQELERIGSLLLAEATRNLPTNTVRVNTPLVETTGRVLAAQPIVVPVLRAGLGFLHAAQELLPNADVGFIGVSRDEETFQPKSYVNKLPENLAGRQCIVLDPMLATGGSLAHACKLLDRARCDGHDHRGVRARSTRGHQGARGRRTRPGDLHRCRRRAPERERVHRARPGRCGRPSVRLARLISPSCVGGVSLSGSCHLTKFARGGGDQR